MARKPHIRAHGNAWVCYLRGIRDNGRIVYGWTPTDAYRRWALIHAR